MKVMEINYMAVTDLIYDFVCEGEVFVEWGGFEWELIGYHEGGDGAYPSAVFQREENGWVFYAEFFYCRESKEIVGIKREEWKKLPED